MKVSRKPKDRVPPHLLPKLGYGYVPALTIYKNSGALDVSVDSTTIDLDGNVFNYVGYSTERLAAIIARKVPSLVVIPNISVVLGTGSLLLETDDFAPNSGYVVRYLGFATKVEETTKIRLLPPYSASASSAWHVRVNSGTFKVNIAGIDYLFSVPEYYTQPWSPRYGFPYVEHSMADCEIVGKKVIRLPRTPVVWAPGNISLYRDQKLLDVSYIDDIDEYNGLVYFKRPLEVDSSIQASYVYHEKTFIYKQIDLNPTTQHNPFILNKVILFYLEPYKADTGAAVTATVNHSVGETVEGAISRLGRDSSSPKVLLGGVRIREASIVGETSIFDSRSGGGGLAFNANVGRQNESAFYTDIGQHDGIAYPGNAAILFKVPSYVLETLGKEEVEDIVRRHIALGVVPVIQFEE